MVVSFKNMKYKTLNKIIGFSQMGFLGLTSDKTSMVTLHLPVYLGSQAIIKQLNMMMYVALLILIALVCFK